MTRSIAHIAIILLLIVQLNWLVTSILPLDRQQSTKAYGLTLPGDMEDTDDSNSQEDSDTDESQVFIMEGYSSLVFTDETEDGQPRPEHRFVQHDREVVSPPPKA